MRICLLTILAIVPAALAQPRIPAQDRKDTAPDNKDTVPDKKDSAPNASRGVEVKLPNLDDFVVKVDQLTVNNFSLHESEEAQVKGMTTLKFAASCKNRSTEVLPYTIMVAGLDEKGGVLWSMKTYGSVEARGVGLIQDYALMPEGTLKGTARVWIRVLVVPQQGTPGNGPRDR